MWYHQIRPAFLLVSLILLLADTARLVNSQANGDVRLVNGSSQYEGRVEVYYNGDWGTVCDDDWDIQDGDVVCAQLGYDHAVTVQDFSAGSGTIGLDNVDCAGSESTLLECGHNGWGVENCVHVEDAGVVCSNQTSLVYAVRLVDGTDSSQGRVEIQNAPNGQWKTICTEGSWDINDSHVLCRQLGYDYATHLIGYAYFGQALNGVEYNTDDFNCHGNESSLSECDVLRDAGGSHVCSASDHEYDTGVVCGRASSVTAGESNLYIRLVDGSFAGQGRLEVYYNGQWGSVCDDYWNTDNANVVCRELGFGPALDFYISVGDADISPGTGPIWLDDVSCSGQESSLFSCSHHGWSSHNCGHSEDVAVICTIESKEVRLVGTDNAFTGRLEIYDRNQWSTVCDNAWDVEDAEVACRMAGFPGVVHYYGNAAFGQGTGDIILSNLACDGTEESLLECSHSGLYTHACEHSEDVGLECRPHDYQLVGGNNDKEGRVEVFYQGTWATVCDDNWDLRDGNVVCRSLGYGDAVTAQTNAYYGEGSGVIALDDLRCVGTETELSDCIASDWEAHNCDHSEDAGVVCRDLGNGDLKLVGGDTQYEGRIEVYYDGEWGTVCDDYFDITDGNVVCTQLGLGPAKSIYGSAYFGTGSGPIVFDDVYCSGDETNITKCSHSGWGSHNCHHSEDAGVKCGTNGGDSRLNFGAICLIIIGTTVALIILMMLFKSYSTNNNRCGNNATNDQRSGVSSASVIDRGTDPPPAYHFAVRDNPGTGLHGFPSDPSYLSQAYDTHYSHPYDVGIPMDEYPVTPPPSYESVLALTDLSNQPGSTSNQPGSVSNHPGSISNQPGSTFNQPGNTFNLPGSTYNHHGSTSNALYQNSRPSMPDTNGYNNRTLTPIDF